MRNLTLEEIKGSKNFKEFCELSNYSLEKIINNLGSSFAVWLLNEDDDEYTDTDTDINYPYIIFNPFGLDIKAE